MCFKIGFQVLIDWRGGEGAEIGSIVVMAKPGQGQFAGSQAAADLIVGFENRHAPAGTHEVKRADEAVVTGPDDDRIVISHCPEPPRLERAMTFTRSTISRRSGPHAVCGLQSFRGS